MHYYRFRRPSSKTVFAVLMAVSLTCLFLPRDLFRPARSMTQLTALPQYAVKRAAEHVADGGRSLRKTVGASDEAEALAEQFQALQNAHTVLQQQVIQLEATVEELTAIRGLDGLPVEANLIPARVIAYDAAQGRESLSLSQGSQHRVRKGDWVASFLDVAVGAQQGVQDNLAVLARQTLIGLVEQTASHTSRVVLLSDPVANKAMRVHVVQADPHAQRYLPVADLNDSSKKADFALQGIGKGQMRIRDIDARFVQSEAIRVNDLVTSDDRDPRLPCSLVMGQIVELRQDKKNPLLYDAIVHHRCDPKELERVFIVRLAR